MHFARCKSVVHEEFSSVTSKQRTKAESREHHMRMRMVKFGDDKLDSSRLCKFGVKFLSAQKVDQILSIQLLQVQVLR